MPDDEAAEWACWSDMCKDWHGVRPRQVQPTRANLEALIEWHQGEFPDGILEADGSPMRGTPAEMAARLFPVLWSKDLTLHVT